MFQAAFGIARGYTRPVVFSTRTVSGKCKSGIGSFVILNDEGWILTAYHILADNLAIVSAEAETKARLGAIAAIRADADLSAKDRAAKLKSIRQPKPDDIQNGAVWWGGNGVQLVDAGGIPAIDLALGRLVPFDPSSVPRYPTIKNPALNFEPGVSLCKLGYPFYDVPVAWDAEAGGFNAGGAPLAFPLFPIEGMLTRFVQDPAWVGNGVPLLQLETSTPGLRGQSGGPIFDVQGRVWAIQSLTAHLPLGFDPEVKAKDGTKHREHQFLNVGRGVHAATIVGLLSHLGVKFDLSNE